jgi:hypothetical protein
VFENPTLSFYLHYLLAATVFSVMHSTSMISINFMTLVEFTILNIGSCFHVTFVILCTLMNLGRGLLSFVIFICNMQRCIIDLLSVVFIYIRMYVCYFFLYLCAPLVSVKPCNALVKHVTLLLLWAFYVFVSALTSLLA